MPVISQTFPGIAAILADDVTNSTSNGSGENNAFNELLPAVTQCFVIMLGGYIAGRVRLISPVEAKGLNMFVSYASLPALIFLSLVTLDFSNVNWMFLIAILISKSFIFFFVSIVTSVVNWPNNFGKAGLYGIFCTQSNDFALGYPIVVALYSRTNPEYASYLYLVAPISLCFLNPIGFVLMEIDKEKSSMFNNSPLLKDQEASTSRQANSNLGCGSVVARVIKGVLSNPVVVTTLMGVVGNFALRQRLPDIIYGCLKVMGSSYSATALFLLGLNMVGKVSTIRSSGNLLIISLLILIKLIALPLITKEVISLMAVSHIIPDYHDVANITEYGFLYGTFPTAPSVFVFASVYGIAVDVIASAMVMCTFLSAPLMFISAKMITLQVDSPKAYYVDLDYLVFNLSIISIVCTVWFIVIMIFSKKCKRVPHIFTIILMCLEMMAICGVWIGRFSSPKSQDSSLMYVNFLLITIGIYSSRFMAAVIALSTALLQMRKLCLVLRMRKVAPVLAFCLPCAVFVLYCVLNPLSYKPMNHHEELAFMIDKPLAGVVLVLDLICLIVTLACTMVQQYYIQKLAIYRSLLVNDKDDLTPEKEKQDRIRKSLSTGDLLRSVKIDPTESESTVKKRPYPSRRDEILCENFGICKRRSYKDSLLVTGYETKKRVPSEIESLGFQFSLRGLGLPVGSDHTIRSLISDDVEQKDNHVEVTLRNKASCLAVHNIHSKEKQKCEKLIKSYQAVVVDQNEDDGGGGGGGGCGSETPCLLAMDDEHEYSPHLILVIYICVTMLADISTASCILLMEKPNGIYIELEFLNSILTYSLGIIIFLLFGIDFKLVLVPLIKRWRRFWHGTEAPVLKSWDDLSTDTTHICEQFSIYHKEKCMADIVNDKRWRLRFYKSVFWGSELVWWLVRAGLAQDSAEAVKYGQALLEGQIIKHLDDKHHFHNAPYFYAFVSSAKELGVYTNHKAIPAVNSRSRSDSEMSSS